MGKKCLDCNKPVEETVILCKECVDELSGIDNVKKSFEMTVEPMVSEDNDCNCCPKNHIFSFRDTNNEFDTIIRRLMRIGDEYESKKFKVTIEWLKENSSSSHICSYCERGIEDDVMVYSSKYDCYWHTNCYKEMKESLYIKNPPRENERI